MLLSELLEQVHSAFPPILDYGVLLASPDPVEGDDVDVYLAGICNVDIDRDKNEIRLIPTSDSDPSGTGNPFFFLRELMRELPFDTALSGDFEIVVELPLDSALQGRVLKEKVSVTALHVGQASGEAWFLARPASTYAQDVLPT